MTRERDKTKGENLENMKVGGPEKHKLGQGNNPRQLTKHMSGYILKILILFSLSLLMDG